MRPLQKIVVISLALFLAVVAQTDAAPVPLRPKTSQHASFKPENFERLAVIVKPFKPDHAYSRLGNRQPEEQGQVERQIEQAFLRVLIGGGYTLVSRGDMDAAMKEKGLDQANMTDDKRNREAGKLLHVASLMIVTVDSFKTTPVQYAAAPGSPAYQGAGGGFRSAQNNSQTLYQVTASISARLVKIDDNMVLWTGDLATMQTVASQDQDTVLLATVAEAIAKAFPPLAAPPTPTAAGATNATSSTK